MILRNYPELSCEITVLGRSIRARYFIQVYLKGAEVFHSYSVMNDPQSDKDHRRRVFQRCIE